MHEKRVMHRSLNPHCILMIQKDANYEVSSFQDFDTSYHLTTVWMVRQCFMMEEYMLPPEVRSGDAQDCRVDVWSLG